MECKISCIIPFYNISKELLIDCVDSILKQDFENYEILIVNDGSDKDYASCLDEIRQIDSRIQIIHQSNQGVSAARNAGMQSAKGDYIAFMDADDMAAPFFFSEALHVATEYNADYVVGGEVYITDRKRPFAQTPSPVIEEREAVKYRSSIIVVRDRLPEGGFYGRGPVARLIRRDIALQTPFPEHVVMGEDIIWNLDVLSKCDKVYLVHQIWYLYWKNPNSASTGYNPDMIKLSEQHLNELILRINEEDEQDVLAYFLRMYEFLRRHVYGCYFGKKECPLSDRDRAQIFRELCRQEPWSWYRSRLNMKNCDMRTRLKERLLRSGFLYRFWRLRDRVKKNDMG